MSYRDKLQGIGPELLQRVDDAQAEIDWIRNARDGKRLGDQLRALEAIYGADTFYVAIVGNTLRGHRSRGAVERESPNTAILVGEAALNEITQSSVGGELLLRTYQRAFRAASRKSGYNFVDIVAVIAADFEKEAERGGTDFLSAWLHEAVGGLSEEQDSRVALRGSVQRAITPGRRRRRAKPGQADSLLRTDRPRSRPRGCENPCRPDHRRAADDRRGRR